MQYLLWPLSEQFQNKNGSILTNGKVYVYYRGRTALATTWSDEDGTVENPQPIILDDNGRAACYVNPAYYYTVVVCDFYGKELFSYDISLHDGTGTGDNNIEITSSDHSILIEKTSIIDGYRYDEKVNPEFVAEVAVSAVSDLIPNYWNNDRTIVIDDSSKEIKTDMQSVMIRQQINNSYYDYKYAKICETDLNILTWINEWMTTLQLSFQSNGAYYSGKSSGIFVLNCENYIQSSSTYVQRHEEDGKWLLFDKDTSSPQISKLYLYWRDDFTSQHYELWGEFNNLKYYEGVGVAALINCCLRNHLTSSLPIEQERNIWRFNSIGIETLKDSLPTDAGDLVNTFDPADADIKPTVEPDPGTFYATYVYNGPASGNTSFYEIKEAYEAGKSVYVNYKENTDSKDTQVFSLELFRDTPVGRPDLSCFFFTNLDRGTEKCIYRFPSNWGKMTDRNLALSDNLLDLTQSIAQDDYLVPIPSPSGVYCTRNYEVYKAIEPITSNTWVASAWTKVTVMDEVLNLVSSTSGTTDVFIAKYMETPVSAVFEAVDEGKFVWVSLGTDGHGPFLPMNVTSTEVGGTKTNYVRFEGLNYYGNDEDDILLTTANSDGWSAVRTAHIAHKEFVLSTVSGASSILETEIQTVSSAIETISGQNGVFIAEYGTTTFEEIGEAVADGKAVFGKGHPYNSDMLLPIASFTSPRPSIAIFSGIVGNYQYSIKLDGTTWSNNTIILAKNEDVVNADWDATSGKAEILNKPDIEPVSAGTGIEIVEVSGTMVISSTGGGSNYEAGQYISIVNDQISATGLVDQSTYNTDSAKYESAYSTVEANSAIWNETQVNADWEATSGVAEILNKPTMTPVSGGTGIEIEKVDGKIVISATGSVEPTSGVFFAEYGVTTLAEVETALSEGKEVIAYYDTHTEWSTWRTYAYMFTNNAENEEWGTEKDIVFKTQSDQDSYQELILRSTGGWSTDTIFFRPWVSGGIDVIDGPSPIYKPYLQAKVDGTSIGINSSGALESLVDGLPISTSSDEGKVLTIDSNGDASWYGSVDNWDEAYNVVNASADIWNEAAAMDEYPVSAGPGIKIEDVDDVTVFSTSGVMMEADLAYNGQGEISGYNGSPIMTVDSEKQWLTHDDTIAHVTNSAQYAFGVNVPVVKAALGEDRTVLFEGEMSGTLPVSASLLEPTSGFNTIEVVTKAGNLYWFAGGTERTKHSATGIAGGTIYNYAFSYHIEDNNLRISLEQGRAAAYRIAGNSIANYENLSTTNYGEVILVKVVGIGRKENT